MPETNNLVNRMWRQLSACWTLPDADAAARSRLLNWQLRALFLIVPIFGVTNSLSVAGLVLLLWPALPLRGTAIWCFIYFVCQAGWAGHALRRIDRRSAFRKNGYTTHDLWGSAFWCALTAICWVTGLYLSAPLAYSGEDRILLLSFVPGLIAAGVLASITVPLISAVWLGVMIPSSCLIALGVDYINRGLMIAFVILYGVMLTSAFLLISRMFVERIAAELATEHERQVTELLAVDLRRQKEIAEELAIDLRRQKEIAEDASRAKSSFLAAASHDLRQPVHALSLFVGALRDMPMSPEVEHLVGQIDASTNAMDGLFTALLDISKLDAGVVEVHRRPFAIGAVLARACRDHAGEASAKGVALSCVPCSAIVDSDPILVERVIRNLVSNAVRYTDRGRIVVGCRRRGSHVAVQIWDTGRGIPPDQHERVFQEYHQLGNPERDRTKGLGLGLAIVRRVTDLLACRVTLRSEPGRGSCFEVAIERSQREPGAPEASADEVNRIAAAGLVVVVDDEQAIRAGMSSLLTGWGYEVVAAASADEAIQLLATHEVRPDLLICDFRLRNGENGIEAIEKLRAEYNEAIPAMLITGDTAAGRLVEAYQASGLVLLHKPVPNGRLRAAMTHLIGARDGDSAGAQEAAGDCESAVG
ncbi:Integral membrane sensor hybrid histidine kinase [Paraburkholderia ribeironis]|uniref:histidine kinase n=1 Tax=Paraburkholderia ribeironis TaxID=1247936 RepID=A0A1N7RYI3_9BURK|nr:ATP-binding protein [Paraburkholderia ribeironis]SIT40119.1 Integral membrane sensor hybrid histidine kinase [Paraburkholderia ribeironis]